MVIFVVEAMTIPPPPPLPDPPVTGPEGKPPVLLPFVPPPPDPPKRGMSEMNVGDAP
jgi:hypothetical protein